MKELIILFFLKRTYKFRFTEFQYSLYQAIGKEKKTTAPLISELDL